MPRNGNGVPIHEKAISSNSPDGQRVAELLHRDVDDLDLDADLGQLALHELGLVLRHRHADELREADGQTLAVLLADTVGSGDPAVLLEQRHRRVGVVGAELTGVVDVERRVLDEHVVVQRLGRPRDAGEVGHADGGPVERHLDRLADHLVLDQAAVGSRVHRHVTPVRAGSGANLGARRVERQGVAVGIGTDVERVELVVGERLRRGVRADHRELDRVEQRRGRPTTCRSAPARRSGRRRRTCRPRTDR